MARDETFRPPYRSVDEAIRDGWRISYAPGPHWWGRTDHADHRYHVTAKHPDDGFNVELAGNNIGELRRELRRLSVLIARWGFRRASGMQETGRSLRFTAEWWAEQRRND